MTDNFQIVSDAVRTSSVVEMQVFFSFKNFKVKTSLYQGIVCGVYLSTFQFITLLL